MKTAQNISELEIHQAGSAKEIDQARELFLEYAKSLGFSLCFQGFDKEMAGLPGDYPRPLGACCWQPIPASSRDVSRCTS